MKKKNKNNTINVLSSLEVTHMKRERFNPYQTGTGVHKSDKYPSRARRKALFRREMD